MFTTDRKSPLQELGGATALPAVENTPFAYSGKHYTFEKHETAILANMKKWANQYFS